MRRITSVLVVALTLAGCGGDSGPTVTKAEGNPGSVVEADGHDVYFHCEGEGSPTVVFLSGLGTGASTWSSVFDDSARLTRSCQYDRYGLGVTGFYGVLPQRARNADDQVRELEQLLEHGKIEAPYVFVGHSWGGALTRLYAGRHDDVEGVVFVDSSTPGRTPRSSGFSRQSGPTIRSCSPSSAVRCGTRRLRAPSTSTGARASTRSAK
jgi:pimeloyl-ACP methyl ester carboxylesterase